ncbi:MAG: 4Fe-4S ferredoxin [Candidatus Cloacimonetes bacterium HGW-Cloacimonetes-3]|jgi:polyferredoxin|nr:MAG: 4Fe-4S ferredoxin [Candidatus Cloacimonetes bacterium HGW-Cloacimonetes-3]
MQILALLCSSVFVSLIILGYKQAIHAICPYATVCFGISPAGFFSLSVGAFWFTAIAGVIFLIHSMFHGRVFCGYLCPLGTIQEALFSLRSAKYSRSHRVPYFYEVRFAGTKYPVLLITSLLSIIGIAYIFIRFCPIYAISMFPRLAIPGLAVLTLIVAAGLYIERFWCRYLCPYAALLNLFQMLGSFVGIKRRKISRNLERCIDCGICEISCPMNLQITEQEFVQSNDCIHCNLCAAKCPKPGTICCQKETDI